MKIIIVGDGKVGYTLAENLSKEDHDVTIVDKNPEALRRAHDNLDVMCIKGSGVSVTVLLEAGIRDADLLLAATSSDEMNMVCALTGKKLGAKRTVARIRDPEYANELSMLKNELDLDMIINPEQATALEIVKLLQFPSALNVESFARGRVRLIEIKVTEDVPIIGMKLKKISGRINASVLIGAIERQGEVFIPDGEAEIMVNDTIYIVGNTLNTFNFCKALGKCTLKVRRVMIVGGGRIGYYLSKMIIQMGMKVKLIEIDKARCQELSELLPEALIIQGDGTNTEFLDSENLRDMDAFIAMTGRDEDNLILSLLAKQAGVQKVISKVARINSESLIKALEIDSIVSPRLITANHILQYVRGLKNAQTTSIETLYKTVNGQAEILEFLVRQDRWYLNTPLKKLKMIKNTIIAAIVRKNDIIIPHGSDVLHLNDRIILFAKVMALDNLDDVFLVSEPK
ncbi:MAG: Trk system potassium transporter TrkA [Bacillota bacterium]|nr:Trk system potassium transporter TrkA [Bacillota bacterium]